MRAKTVRTNLAKYGVTNPSMLEDVKKKMRETCLKNNGVDCMLRLKEVRDKAFEIIKKKNENFVD